MNPDQWASRRRSRTIARILLIAGLALFIFSSCCYTSWFPVRGSGFALHSGRISLIFGSNTSGMASGASCFSTAPIVLFKPLFVSNPQSTFIAIPLWIVGFPAAALLMADAWLVIRARRGRCFSCGYSLVGLPQHLPCPECGLARQHSEVTQAEHASRFGRAIVRRSLFALGALGVVVALAWVLSGFYVASFSRSRQAITILRSGRIEHIWNVPVNPYNTYEMGWKAFASRSCGWEFGSVVPPFHNGTGRILIVPLWWIAPPLLACPLVLLRRRRAKPVAISQSAAPPPPNVPSNGDTP